MKYLLVCFLFISACSSHQPVIHTSDPEGIRQGILDKKPELVKCATQFAPVEKAEYSYMFSIQADGTTTDHKIQTSDALHKDLEACVIDKMKGLKFMPVQGGGKIDVKQPINLWQRPQ